VAIVCRVASDLPSCRRLACSCLRARCMHHASLSVAGQSHSRARSLADWMDQGSSTLVSKK